MENEANNNIANFAAAPQPQAQQNAQQPNITQNQHNISHVDNILHQRQERNSRLISR
ncbi:hypothetical protein N9W34_02860 [Rickettsiales bacterium]|nr:hypothetical protein [Rickettsiales bacterium]